MEYFFNRDHVLNALHVLQQLDHQDGPSPAAQTYIQERNAMASTAVDIKEYPVSYVFIADMPGIQTSDVKVTVEDGNVLSLFGERKKVDEANAKVKYLAMERRAVKFMRKFHLPSNADTEHISAVCKDGVLTVTVPKVPPPVPKVVSVNVS